MGKTDFGSIAIAAAVVYGIYSFKNFNLFNRDSGSSDGGGLGDIFNFNQFEKEKEQAIIDLKDVSLDQIEKNLIDSPGYQAIPDQIIINTPTGSLTGRKATATDIYNLSQAYDSAATTRRLKSQIDLAKAQEKYNPALASMTIPTYDEKTILSNFVQSKVSEEEEIPISTYTLSGGVSAPSASSSRSLKYPIGSKVTADAVYIPIEKLNYVPLSTGGVTKIATPPKTSALRNVWDKITFWN